LEHPQSSYHETKFEIFLQGSYGNDTNTYSESDVDLVICLNSIFRGGIDRLNESQKRAYNSAYGGATYRFTDFKAGVFARLQAALGDDVKLGSKAINIKARGARRSADVLACFQYRDYTYFNSETDQCFSPGIIFPTVGGLETINYPKIHLENATKKHQATGGFFKPLVRIFKNIRMNLVGHGIISKSIAPSYFIEGLLYNVPNSLFAGSYRDTVLEILRWLNKTPDKSSFTCVNERHYLLRDRVSVCWPPANAEHFIYQVIERWKKWR